MKAGIIFTGTGPILILTSCSSFTDPKLIEKLAAKGIRKFIACELPVESVKKKYKKILFTTSRNRRGWIQSSPGHPPGMKNTASCSSVAWLYFLGE